MNNRKTYLRRSQKSSDCRRFARRSQDEAWPNDQETGKAREFGHLNIVRTERWLPPEMDQQMPLANIAHYILMYYDINAGLKMFGER